MSVAGWTTRSRSVPGGGVVRWLERPLAGTESTVERVYLSDVERFGPVVGSLALVQPGEVVPRRRSATSSGTPNVLITNKAFEGLWEMELLVGREAAGGCFGRILGDSITIRLFTSAATNRSYAACQMDTRLLDRQAERLKEEGLSLVGTWHTEPTAGSSDPSPADLQHWRSFCRAHGSPFFIGLTVRRPHEGHIGFRGSSIATRLFRRTSDGVVGPIGPVELIEQNPWIL